jgi:hypothetical protein
VLEVTPDTLWDDTSTQMLEQVGHSLHQLGFADAGFEDTMLLSLYINGLLLLQNDSAGAKQFKAGIMLVYRLWIFKLAPRNQVQEGQRKQND